MPDSIAQSRQSATLTRGIARGDREAFAVFYESWFDRTLVLTRAISRRDESFCLDVVQDVMLRVVRSMKPLLDDSAVERWMGRAVLTTTIDRMRADHRRRRREGQAAVADVVDAAEHPAEAREREVWLAARLEELPAEERRLILERYADGRTLEAVGRALGISGHAAHGRIRRTLCRLRDAAREWCR